MANKSDRNLFPKKFYWGVSTASHQVEGDTVNQWTVWELAHTQELAKSASKRLNWLPNWDKIKDRAQDPNNYVSGRGVEHLKYYREDFAIAKKLNMNAFRFSVEWSRIEPTEGQWDEQGIEHYRRYIRELKRKGLEPFLNVWHWTVPTWFDELGGFSKKNNLRYFNRFVNKLILEYGDELNYVIVLNEPNVFMVAGYLVGEWPPGKKSFLQAIITYRNLVKAHKQSYKTIKANHKAIQVGVAQAVGNIQAKRPHNVFDEIVTKLMRYSWNWWFLRRVRNHQDFVGLNYYYTDYYKAFVFNEPHDRDPRNDIVPLVRVASPKTPVNDLGRYMEPEGLYPLLTRTWARFKKPIYVTENGVPDEEDQYRQWWIEETIVAMERAISEGVDLRGYFHWSLLDNFEWAYGWWPKFGLVKVDREHGMKRTVRPSAKWFAQKIASLK